jgi:iron(III) transport system substrate-binding protein
VIAEFGEFEYEPIDARAYGELNARAVQLMNRAGYP